MLALRAVLMLVTEPNENEDQLVRTVAAAVAGGVDLVQLRDKRATAEALFRVGQRLRDAIGGRALLVINRPSLDGVVLADGVHLPETGPPVAEARRHLGEAAVVGRSVHSLAAAVAAEAEGADYVVAGTVFASPSHPDVPPTGLEFLREICARVSVPVLAIGGVTPENAGDCLRAGAAGVAALSPLMRAADPERAAAAYRRALDAVRPSGATMQLTVNGKPREVEQPLTLAAFLAALNLHERMIVVERNGEIVRRERFGDTLLEAGDTLEIVQMMAGG